MENALSDEPQKGRPIKITEEAAAWIVNKTGAAVECITAMANLNLPLLYGNM